jgi:hypothetical protein
MQENSGLMLQILGHNGTLILHYKETLVQWKLVWAKFYENIKPQKFSPIP